MNLAEDIDQTRTYLTTCL